MSELDNAFFVLISCVSCETSDMTAFFHVFPLGGGFLLDLCSVPTNSSDVHLIVFFNSHGPLFPLLNSILVSPELHLVSSSLLTDPVLQVPTHVAEYVPLTCFSTWVYVHVSISAAPVCNKGW